MEDFGAAFVAAPYHSAGVDSSSSHSLSEEGMILEVGDWAPRYSTTFASPSMIVNSWS